ncbi:MAG TPA: ABC transporter permease [Steroidobacteraceae bacterium]|jgi:ABC-type multidrug transport system permease subunit|nr:ABC transporter permease [Steroidobacteraceae bacterium]
MIRRLLAVWHARNLEFIRDRATLIFTLLLPIGLVVGMGFVFGGPARPLFKVGVVATSIDKKEHPFLQERYVDFVPIANEADGLQKITHQQIDLLVDLKGVVRYWVNTDSPKGYIVEKLLLAAAPGAQRQPVTGAAVRYVDWLFPGILGMNMMFSCLFGVGYVVLRYRKTGFLKRLHATPLTAFEFLTAQVLSRLCLILFVTTILYVGVGTIIHFHSAGNIALLLLLAVLGALSMIALGLTIAAGVSSEELVGGMLNLLTWPMMLVSGIWFSLEGSPRWVQWAAHIFPLTHVLEGGRAVMLDGAGIAQITPNLLYLAVTALIFLTFGAWSFRWRVE